MDRYLHIHPVVSIYGHFFTTPTLRWASMYKRPLIAVAMVLASTASVADNFIPTTAIDPANTCSVLDKNLPDKLSSIRHIGRVRKEKVVGDADYCEHQAKECDIHTIEFDGLTLQLLAKKRTQEASPLVATLSSSRWNLLGDLKVGQPLEVLEKYYGVTIPRDVSPVVLEGECTPLTIWHADGRITQLKLDCQACI